MPFETHPLLPLISRFLVGAGWVWFFVFFVFRQQPGGGAGARRDRFSVIGIVLQMVAFALVWMIL